MKGKMVRHAISLVYLLRAGFHVSRWSGKLTDQRWNGASRKAGPPIPPVIGGLPLPPAHMEAGPYSRTECRIRSKSLRLHPVPKQMPQKKSECPSEGTELLNSQLMKNHNKSSQFGNNLARECRS